MNCFHPHRKKVVNPLTGEERLITYPCGYCVNCLHQQQDSWKIRLDATTAAYGGVIYDTLTIRPEAMQYNDVYEDCCPSDYAYLRTHSDQFRKIDDASWKWLIKHDFYVPFFPKSEVQLWLKRGREAFKRHYGVRCGMKFWIAQEYGPSTSRPHFHALFWGISFKDYCRFFGNPWKEQYGFTKPKYVPCDGADNRLALRKICSYVSKYVTKGTWEVPVVAAGLMERCYRCISNGIGAELLDQPYFHFLKDPAVRALAKYTAERYSVKVDPSPREVVPDPNTPSLLADSLSRLENDLKPVVASAWDDLPAAVPEAFVREKLDELSKGYAPWKRRQTETGFAGLLFSLSEAEEEDVMSIFSNLCKGILPDGRKLTEMEIRRISIFYDDLGFPHPMPRYYLDRLTKSHEYNFLSYAISALLQQSALVQYNSRLAQVADKLGLRIPCLDLQVDSSLWGLSESQLFMVTNQLAIIEKLQAQTLGERRKTLLNNHYTRSAQNKDAPALL